MGLCCRAATRGMFGFTFRFVVTGINGPDKYVHHRWREASAFTRLHAYRAGASVWSRYVREIDALEPIRRHQFGMENGP